MTTTYPTRSLTDAPQRGWGQGWPADRRDDMDIATGGGCAIRVHQDITLLVASLLDATDAQYPLRSANCWGYANRSMKHPDGTPSNTPSNHSWGLAIDLNANTNGFGHRARHDIPEIVAALWEKRGFNWGGRWNTPDYMHFEFAGTPADAALLSSLLLTGPGMPDPSEHPTVGAVCGTRTGHGYWIVSKRGSVYAYGDAPFYGGANAINLAAPICGIVPYVDGTGLTAGYWLVGADGGTFEYGAAPQLGNPVGALV